MTLSSVLRPWGNERISRELAAAEFLAAQGVPVSRPTSEPPPGPHRCRGLWLSFWEHLEVDAGATPDPEVVGARLRELHRVFRRCPGSAAALDVPTSDIGEFLRMGGNLRVVGSADLEGVERRFATVLPRLGTSRAPHRWLHGDAHPRNLLRANDEWVWTDFEECVFGPVEWDLACLRGSRRIDGAAALRAYGGDESALPRVSPEEGELPEERALSEKLPRPEEGESLEPFRELRELQSAVWLAVLAERFPECGGRAREALDRQV